MALSALGDAERVGHPQSSKSHAKHILTWVGRISYKVSEVPALTPEATLALPWKLATAPSFAR